MRAAGTRRFVTTILAAALCLAPAAAFTQGSEINGLVTDERWSWIGSAGPVVPLLDGLGSMVAQTDGTGAIQTQLAYETYGKSQTTGTTTPTCRMY